MKKVEATINISTTPERIIQAFTNNEMLREWWSVERALIQKYPGGLYTLIWDITEKGFGFIATGIVKNYEPNSILVVANYLYLNPEREILGPMTLTIMAKEKNDGAELYLCQDGYQSGADWDWYYEAVQHAWPVVLQSLKKYLEKLPVLDY